MSFVSTLVSGLAAKYLVNTSVRVDGAQHGKEVLFTALEELNSRLQQPHSVAVEMEAMLMKSSMIHVVEVASRDFAAFSEQWECTVRYHDHSETSNVFVFYFKKKEPQGKDYEFRFSGLSRVAVTQ